MRAGRGRRAHAQLGRLHPQFGPHRTPARRWLHMQSPAVPTAATGTLTMTPSALMAKPLLLE
eukprot:2800415-Alexandrium_andersonii.AAC.1